MAVEHLAALMELAARVQMTQLSVQPSAAAVVVVAVGVVHQGLAVLALWVRIMAAAVVAEPGQEQTVTAVQARKASSSSNICRT